MIIGYRDRKTRDFAAGKWVRAFSGIERSARLKMDRLEAAAATTSGESASSGRADTQARSTVEIVDFH